jgi:hypothetical protein
MAGARNGSLAATLIQIDSSAAAVKNHFCRGNYGHLRLVVRIACASIYASTVIAHSVQRVGRAGAVVRQHRAQQGKAETWIRFAAHPGA